MNYRNHLRTIVASAAFASALVAVACSSEKKEDDHQESSEHSTQTASGGAATGDTIVIEVWTDGTGNYFKPNDIEAHPGDVLRFELKVGVHNVHFLPDSNTIKTGLPPASELLQLPGQTYDLPVTMQPGHYYFQCDPHAALGMKGHLEVEEKD
jgi:plastocyanin